MKNIKSNSKRLKKATRIFLFSLAISLTLISFVVGILVVDYTCRSTVFADKSPILSVEEEADGTAVMTIHTMGVNKDVDVTKEKEIWEFICKLFCLPTMDNANP